MIEINKLSIEYKEQITAFDMFCFPTDFWKIEDWEDLLSDERAIYYALTDEDKIVGDVFIYNWKGEKDYIKIMNIAVHPDYRGKGLAHRLLNHVTSEMDRSACKNFAAKQELQTRQCRRFLRIADTF